jgi:ADP-heptose:LPS heptosyltransferase
LIERLNDSFEPEYCALYDRAFAQVLSFYRHLPGGRSLDAGLRRFGLLSEEDLLIRKARLPRPPKARRRSLRAIRKVVLLSRVTLGADVAVTSVILRGLQQVLPDAELVLFGPGKLRQLFSGDARVRIREIPYERGGDVLARLGSWLEVVKAADEEQRGLRPDELWVIDPDSRLTQLGLLPVVEEEASYSFFESRSYRRPGAERLGPLAAHWLNEILGTSGQIFPYVALPREEQVFGQELCRKLRRGGAAYLVSVSLGVGGNPRKRLPDPFEADLLRYLLAEATLILDKGGSEEERDQVNRLIEALSSQGKVVVEVNESNAAAMLRAEAIRGDVFTWEGGIGAFAALITASDEYLGYDSAGQHIAAALGTPTITVFAGSDSALFTRRWSPSGPGMIEVLEADPTRLASGADSLSDVLARALAAHRKVRDQPHRRGQLKQ